MENVLVTGGAGFIGSNFIRVLMDKENDLKICNLDALTYAGSLENLKGVESDNYEFIHGDIRDLELVENLILEKKIDTIVHFAAETHVDRSIFEPDLFIQTNIYGTFNLLEAARKHWLGSDSFAGKQMHFHHVSTDEVYGTLKPEDPAFTEETPYAPNSPYSAAKASSDHMVRAYHETYGLPVTITNCSNNYGPNQFPEKLIPVIILNAINGNSIPVYGDGKQIRDWLYVTDHCDAIYEVIKNGANGETYNVGGDNQPTNLEIVKTVCGILDEMFPSSDFAPHADLIQFITDRPGHDRRYAMNIEKIDRVLGWKPAMNLREGLQKTVAWYVENVDWIDSIKNKGDIKAWMEKNYQNREKE